MDAHRLSYILENIKNETNSDIRLFNNSDLEQTKNNSIKVDDNINATTIYNIRNKINQNDENNQDNIGEQNNNHSEEEKIKIFQLNFIQKLNNNGYIFIKDYLEQKTDEKNIKYMKWLRTLYKKIFLVNEEKYLVKIKQKNKYEILDYQELYKKLKNNLFTCINPECKSVIYVSDEHKELFENIGNLNLEDYSYEYFIIKGYDKIRCPLCLKYKCKYCNKLSALKISFCCPFQAFKACCKTVDYYFLCEVNLAMYSPFIRVWFFGFMLSFPLYKNLTRPDKLLQSKKEIERRKETMKVRPAFFLYFTKNEDDLDLYNILLISGSILWTFAYALFFEEILIMFMLFSFIINKDYFKKFYDCFYTLCYYPVKEH